MSELVTRMGSAPEMITITTSEDELSLTGLARFLMALDVAVRSAMPSALTTIGIVAAPFSVHGVPGVTVPVQVEVPGGAMFQPGAFQREVSAFGAGYAPLVGTGLIVESISHNSPFKIDLKGIATSLLIVQMLLAGGDIKISGVGGVTLECHAPSLLVLTEQIFKTVGGMVHGSAQNNP